MEGVNMTLLILWRFGYGDDWWVAPFLAGRLVFLAWLSHVPVSRLPS
jgi:hypothetical protein